MLMANKEVDDGDEPFIHGIAAWPEAMCIIGFPYQFHDVARFCCGSLEFYPLCIDTTFNLGEFYVTPTTYKNLLLENARDGKEPVFIGPTLVHMTRSYGSYCHLACKMKEVEPAVADLRASVTDGEPGLAKALRHLEVYASLGLAGKIKRKIRMTTDFLVISRLELHTL